MDRNTEKDTYKYQLKLGGKVILRSITYDLNRREAEHQQEFPGSRIKQVGRKTTHEAAMRWERRGGKRPYTMSLQPSTMIPISRTRAIEAVPLTDCSGRQYTLDEREDLIRHILLGAEMQRNNANIKPIEVASIPTENYKEVIEIRVPTRFYWNNDDTFDGIEFGEFKTTLQPWEVDMMRRCLDAIAGSIE